MMASYTIMLFTMVACCTSSDHALALINSISH